MSSSCRRARATTSAVSDRSASCRALDLIEGAPSWSLEEGYRAEEEALADLLFTPQARASLYAFDLVERRARRGAGRPATKPREVNKVGIAGAGLMATQLATLFLRRLGVPVVLSGGVARGAGELLATPVEERVRVVAPAAAVSVLHAPPVLGAALLVLDLVALGDAAAAERARTGIAEARF